MSFALSTFYRSAEWVKLREMLMFERQNAQGEILCEHCGKSIVRKYDCIAHHKIALTESNVGDMRISLNPDNIMLVHHVCHNRIHNKLGNISRQVYLVWGSPCSGKSSYVAAVREQGDLVVDIDNIWQCVSGCDRYIKPGQLKSNVFGVRDLMLEMVKCRRGKWSNAYVVGGYPLIGERERLIKSLGAREIFINTSYDKCIARLKASADKREYAEWIKYVDDWWRIANTPPGRSIKHGGKDC